MTSGRAVLHVIDTSGPGGGEEMCVRIAAGVAERGWESVVVAPAEGWVTGRSRAVGLPVVVTANGSGISHYRHTRHLARLVRAGAAVVQTHYLDAAVDGALAGLVGGGRVVATFHGVADLQPRRWWWARRMVLRRGLWRSVFVSDAVRTHFLGAGVVDPARAVVIPNGFVTGDAHGTAGASLRAELRMRRDEILVGALGNVRPAKGYDVFLEMAARLSRLDARYRFVVIGDTNDACFEPLLSRRSALGLESCLHFVGFRPDGNRYVSEFDVAVVSSWTEGFSLATLEALSRGVPVVCTRCGGPEFIISDGVEGLLVPPGNPPALADAVQSLTADPAVRARMSEAGMRRAQEFSLEQTIGRYVALYEAALQPRLRSIAP